MRWLRNVWHLGRKEIASLARDTVLFLFLVYSFTFTVYSEATGIDIEVRDASIAIVDCDHSTLSRSISAALRPPWFRPPVLIDRADLDQAMDSGRFSFALEIPPGFEADLLRGLRPELRLDVDATAMSQAGIGDSYIQRIVLDEVLAFLKSRGIEADLPIGIVVRAWFNPNLDSIWQNSLMSVVEQITLLSILLVGAAVIREREHGTIEHLLVMPVRASEIAMAKVAANGLVVLVATAMSLMLVVRGVLTVPIAGSVPLFLSGVLLYLFAMNSLGILLATIANSMPQFGLLATPVFLVLIMLSGANSPIESMPPPLQLLMQGSPTVHFVDITNAVLFRGAGIGVVWPQFLALAAFGTITFAVALARFRGMLARQG